MATATQRHISHPLTSVSACMMGILKLGDHYAGLCIHHLTYSTFDFEMQLI